MSNMNSETFYSILAFVVFAFWGLIAAVIVLAVWS